jgi:hypothetical protein
MDYKIIMKIFCLIIFLFSIISCDISEKKQKKASDVVNFDSLKSEVETINNDIRIQRIDKLYIRAREFMPAVYEGRIQEIIFENIDELEYAKSILKLDIFLLEHDRLLYRNSFVVDKEQKIKEFQEILGELEQIVMND